MYAYAFESVCSYYGEWLNNRYFCPCRYRWFERLDEVLAGGGVPLQFQELLHRLPAAVPDPRGGPWFGDWPGAGVAAALPRLEALLPSLSGDEHQALVSVQGWVAKAVKQPGSIVVGVFC